MLSMSYHYNYHRSSQTFYHVSHYKIKLNQIIREKPPEPPKSVETKLITIGGKELPPPPRKGN